MRITRGQNSSSCPFCNGSTWFPRLTDVSWSTRKLQETKPGRLWQFSYSTEANHSNALMISNYLSLSLVHLGPRTVCHWWLEGVASVQDQTNPNQVWTPCILVAFPNSYLFVASLGSTRRTSVVTVNVTCSQERKSAEFVFRHVWNIWMIQRL